MRRTVRTFLVAAIWLVSGSVAVAQTPTSEQLEIFRNLTPEQQQALLTGMGAPQDGGGSVPSTAQTRSSGAEDGDARRRAGRRVPEEPLVPVLLPEDTVLVEAFLDEAQAGNLDPANRDRLNRLVELIRSGNPYQLDRNAQLNLPGFPPVALSGLTEPQATQRLSLEPLLRPLDMRLSRLPLARSGVGSLKPFGYDLFDNPPSTFSPVTDVPVPADYVIGPGDVLNVQLYGGNQSSNRRLTVNRDGAISFPELGPISISGLTFNAARQMIESRVMNQMIGVQANVSMGDTRAIRVFVLGEARVPGSYTVSGLATMTTALFASGGVKEIGSLRDIQLRRQGALVRRLDLYDLLIRGDTSNDVQLLPGDVIFIPPVGSTVSVDGEVRRPAIYELREEANVSDVVRIAGGLTPEADSSRGSLTRIDVNGRRIVLDVNLNLPAAGQFLLRNGDVLRVVRLRPQIDEGVELEGFVHRPGLFAWREGLRLTDVIGSVDELKPSADQHYILIRREGGPDRRISFSSADLTAALAAPGSAADMELAPRDRVIVFDLAPGRERIIQPLLTELALQSDLARPTELVQVAGGVRAPGQVPLEPGMRISDLLRAGGGLLPSAYGDTAELARFNVNDSGTRQAELITIDLAAVRRGDAAADLSLQPADRLLVKETPDWKEEQTVTLRGEVRFPGTYLLRKGETLAELLERAGGLTEQAFPEGSAFTRSDLKELEQQLLERAYERLRQDVAVLSLQAANAGQASAREALLAGQGLLTELRGAEATGRFVIDLPGLLAGGRGSEKDVVLRDGDDLLIPKLRQEVTVIGEIQNPTSHLYQPGLKRDQYIAKSGGPSKKADKRRIYVVRADGSVATSGGSKLARGYNLAVRPGDTIVVPLDSERMPRLPFWQAVTQILYNVAVSVAAVNSF